jgi:cell division protein FtsB
MKPCPFCKEDVRDDAIKCRYCQSSLLPPQDSAAATPSRDRVTYVVDADLIRFGKFAGATLAVFLVVGAYLFGFKLEASVERVNKLQKDVETASAQLKTSQEELQAAKKTVNTLKTEVENLLAQARSTLGEIAQQKETAIAMVVSIRELNPDQKATLSQVKLDPSSKARPNSKYWVAGTTLRIRFIKGTAQQRDAVRAAVAEWGKHVNLKFDFVEDANAELRIAFHPDEGSWSFVGTDALAVDQTKPTINYGWIEHRTLLHEFGHALGLIEEHQNPKANIKWNVPLLEKDLSGPPNYWSKEQIRETIVKSVPKEKLGDYRDFDPKSIMAMTLGSKYTGGIELGGDGTLSESDRAFIARLYPKQ